MLRTEHIITRIRRETDNEQIGTDQGINDNEIIGYLNDAQDDIYGGIANVFRSAFAKEYRFSCLGGQETYSVPTDAYMDGQAIVLEYSQSGQDDGFTPLKRVTMRERITGSGIPCKYTVANGDIYAWPVAQASQGTFRLVYSSSAPKMDKLRGRVSSVTQVGDQITGLSILGMSGVFTVNDESEFQNDNYLSISNFAGDVLCSGIAYNSIIPVVGIGIVSLESNYTLKAGESVTVGDYVTIGKRSTHTSKLPDNCETYLVSYGAMKVFIRDSSSMAGIKSQEVGAIRAQILDNFAELSADVDSIPNLNLDNDWY